MRRGAVRNRSALLQRLGHVLVHDHPLAGLLFEDQSPAQGGEFVFAGRGDGIFLDGGRGPGEVAVGVDLGIVVESEPQFFVALQ